MKFILVINQQKALDLGIQNINQAHIFDLLTTASTWADPEIIDNQVYYWVSRQTIASELILLNLKADTIYRHLKSLAKLELINYKKLGKKDCVLITKKGKLYISKNDKNTMSEINPNHYVGNKSELELNSDLNPSKFGNESEKNSEMNPTYPITKINPTTNNQEKGREGFEKFRNEFKKIHTKQEFYVSGCGFDNVALILNLDGLIMNSQNFRFLPKKTAFDIWNYLYDNYKNDYQDTELLEA